MADSELNVVLRLVDGISDGLKNVGNNITKTGSNLEDFGKELRTVSREAGNLGSTLALWGAAGVAPFALAIKNAGTSIPQVGNAMNGLNDITQAFQESLAKSIVPVIKDFTSKLDGLYQMFIKIPQPMRDAIAQGALVVAVTTLMTGVFIKIGAEIGKVIADIALLAGKFAQWLGVMVATNPVLLAVGVALVALVALMIKFKEVADVVLNAFELLFRSLEAGFQFISSVILETLSKIYGGLAKMYDLIAKLPGPTQKFFQNTADGARNLSKSLDDLANKSFQGVLVQAQKMGNIITTGTGDWARGFDYAKTHLQDFFAAWNQGSTATVVSQKTQQAAMGATMGALGQLQSALQGAAAQNKELAKAAAIVSIGMAIVNTALGVTSALANEAHYPWPVPFIIAAAVAAAGAIQIATIASQSFDVGTPSVPSDMMAKVHKGETIIPATFADAIRTGKLSLSGGQGAQTATTGGVTINVYYPKMSSKNEVNQLANALGLEIQRQSRYARGI